MDVVGAAVSYKRCQIDGNFNMRAHSGKPSYVKSIARTQIAGAGRNVKDGARGQERRARAVYW